MDNWISVDRKKKPKHRQYVLCSVPGFCESGYAIAQFYIGGSFEEEQYGRITEWVKAWQPLPSPPQTSK